jgi:hypothetical protein
MGSTPILPTNLKLMKDKIIELRKAGKTYNEICKLLNCGKGIVCYHSRRAGLGNEIKTLTDEQRKTNNYLKVKSHRQKIKEKAIEYKGGKCEKCGYDKCKWVFDFHHLIPNEKDFAISRYSTLAWDKVKKELDKCIMLCANCHRELHYNEFNNKGL